MTNFTRKFLDEFAKDNKGSDLTIYGSTASGSPAPSSDPEVLQSNPKFRQGWKGATLENLTNNTRNPVTNEWSALNYIHNYHINSILQKGGQDWNVLTEYYIGDIVKDEGTSIYYKSLTNNNIGNALTDIANWQLLGDLADLVNIAPATETSAGVAELATQAETAAGVDDSRIVTPLKLQNKIATETAKGIIDLATQAEANAGVDDVKAITSLKLQGKFDLETPDNVVLVKQESDFGTPSGGVIIPANNTIYKVTGQVIMTSRLLLPEDSSISIIGNAYGIDTLIFVGSGTFISDELSGAQQLKIRELNITDGIGNNTLFNLTGDPLFRKRSELQIYGSDLTNWGAIGTIANHTIVLVRRVAFFQCGQISLDNNFAFTFSSSLKQNFISTNLPFIKITTNLNQAEITGCAFLPAKGESIIDADPALIDTSGISIGPAVPYQGVVSAGIVSFSDAGGGFTTVTVANGHSFQNTDLVLIQNSINYNGGYPISNATPISFDIPVAFVGDDTVGLAVLLNALGTAPDIMPFYRQGVTGTITSIADNGSGFARVNSIAHGLTTGQSLFISNTNAYDAGYYAIVIDVDNFDLLDSFGQPVPFTTPETGGDWDTSSLDEKNNVLTVQNTGGILPDSQTLGNIISTTTQAFASTTLLTRISTGVWFSDGAQRFKATSDGRLIYTGRTTATVSISAKVVVQRQSGTTATAFMNIMEKRVGNPSFTEIANHPSSQNQITSSNSSQLTVAAFVDKVSPGDEFGVGIASDSALTLDIFSIDFNIKK